MRHGRLLPNARLAKLDHFGSHETDCNRELVTTKTRVYTRGLVAKLADRSNFRNRSQMWTAFLS